MSNSTKCKKSKKSPAFVMQCAIRQLMEQEGLWEETLLSDIPKSWEKYGDLLLFNGEKYFRDARWYQIHKLWECICNVLKASRIALKHYIVEDAFRSPNVKLVYGNDTWVEFKDNGIIYCWDIQSSMFCAGNAPERHRVSTMKCEEEIVVDMYAGIGYFTLPYLVKAKAKLVHACEWNPNAIKALKLNLNKNNVTQRCIIHEGDNKLVCPKGIADRVNLGLLPSSEVGWKTACQALNPDLGGTLHVHENVTSGIRNGKKSNENSKGYLLSCETCRTIVHEYDPEDNPMKNKFWCNLENQSFVLLHNAITLIEKVTVKWKRAEWKIWALHVSHKLNEIFLTINGERFWKILITNLHFVKSYAPHIDHLVLDVKCSPCS